MNYEIIKNKKELERFIDILPDTNEGLRYYLTCFSRKKYDSTGTIKNDRQQLKRVLAKKEQIIDKIRQMEIADDAYLYHGQPIPAESLALYISPNPRSLEKANFKLLQEMSKNFAEKRFSFNPQSLSMNCVQTSCGTAKWFDVDIDIKEKFLPHKKLLMWNVEERLTGGSYKFIDTRGGFHLLVELESDLPKLWYQNIVAMKAEEIDFMMSGKDSLVPVPGCTQGGYIPTLI